MNRVSIVFVFLLVSISTICDAQSIQELEAKQSGVLYDGEQLVTYEGSSALVKFIKGEPDKPTVVFIPGNSHLARIAYGGCGECNETDFVSYWLNKKGYSFLGMSYPLKNPVYSEVVPDFSIQDWAKQIVHVTEQLIKENKVSKEVIFAGWSMGGQVSQALSSASKDLGLKLIMYVSFSSTPPLPGLNPQVLKGVEQSPDGLANNSNKYSAWVKQVNFQSKLNKHVIIPDSVYLREFLGYVPIDIIGTFNRYENKTWKKDTLATLNDQEAFLLTYPLVGILRGNSALDARHVMTDHGIWGLYLTQGLYQYVVNTRVELSSIPEHSWNKMLVLFEKLPNKFSHRIKGDHFFFLGSMGAKKTAEKIAKLEKKAGRTMKQVNYLLSKSKE